MAVEGKTTGYLSVGQKPRRTMARLYDNYDYSNVSCMLIKIDQSDRRKMTYIRGDVGCNEHFAIKLEPPLEEGVYIVFIEVSWMIEGLDTFVVSASTEQEVSFFPLRIPDYPSFLQDALKACALSRTAPKNYDEHDEPLITKYMSVNDSKANYGYIYYKNMSKDSVLHETIYFKELSGITIQASLKGKKLVVDVPPQQDYLIVLKKLKSGASFATDTSAAVQLSPNKLLELLEVKAKVTKMKEDDIYFHSLAHDFGYVWACRNKTTNTLFSAKFQFDLGNLELVNSQPAFEVELGPGAQVVKHLRIRDPTKPFNFRYEYTPWLKDIEIVPECIFAEIKQRTTPKQIKYMDKLIPVYYTTYCKNSNYYWHFNNATDKQFKAKLTFTLNNIVLEDPSETDPTSWEIILTPQEEVLKILKVSDYKQPASYQVVMKVTLA